MVALSANLSAQAPGGTLSLAFAASAALHAALLAGMLGLKTTAPEPEQAPLRAQLAASLAAPRAALPPSAPAGSAPPMASANAPRVETGLDQARAPAPRIPAATVPDPGERQGSAAEVPVRRHARIEAAAARAPERRREASLAVVQSVPKPADPDSTARRAPEARSARPPAAADGSAAPMRSSAELTPASAESSIPPDEDSLAQYRVALMSAALTHKLYPEYAVERGWHGRVAIRLVIGADGTVAAASVRMSSGHEVLDREALEMLRKAAALTPLPRDLRAREFSLEIPVRFELVRG